ncbi:MAG: sodium:proton antiporter [Varibaculum sp.]|nr:sodium:proton antiporter [Varibaculum sp.]
MNVLFVIIAILFLTVLMVAIGDRIGLPWPVLLTLIAALAMIIPGVPSVAVPSDMILPLFLPPLLWALARRTSWSVIRAQLSTVVLLSVLLVFITTITVGAVAYMLLPGASIAAALLLGAALAPPDPVAVDAVAEPVGMPRRIISTLQTEGLFNDAASIVAFNAALGALNAGENPSLANGLLNFLYAATLALVLGLVIGTLFAFLLDWIASTVARNALTWVIPFLTYIVAEEIHASGVIAIVIAAVQLNSRAATRAADRLTGHSFWETIEMLFTGLAFGLIGLSVRDATNLVGTGLWHAVWVGLVLSAVLIVVRFAWMWLFLQLNRARGNTRLAPTSAKEVLVMTWCGMRGLVTLALVLAAPIGLFGDSREFAVIALVVLLCTMVVPGLTLPALMKVLRLSKEAAAREDRARERLVRRAHSAAIGVIERHAREFRAEMSEETVNGLRQWLSERTGMDIRESSIAEVRGNRRRAAEVRREALQAAQRELLAARREPGVDPAMVDEVLETIDLRIVANASQH